MQNLFPWQQMPSRREFLQFGLGSYLGLNLGSLWQAQTLAGERLANAGLKTPKPIKSCILIFYYGGPSHLDTYDLKPNAPTEVRGEFKPISTSVPGLQICEHLPKMSRVMHKVAIVRSVHHSATLHDSASIHALTGRPLEGADRELFAPLPQFYPSYGSAVAHFKQKQEAADPACEVPFASLPYTFHNVVPTPCQGAGILGAALDPLLIDVDPANRNFRIEMLQPREGISLDRLQLRRQLLEAIQPTMPGVKPLSDFHAKAYRLLASESIRDALDVSREPAANRERYGFAADPTAKGEVNGGGGEMGYARQMRGQNLLVARRLVEAGVQFVNVYDYKQQGQNWDAHANCANQHKSHLLPAADQSLAALIEDLDERGLLDTTLIVATGEFGRTPKINGTAGRDHWPFCYSVLLAGGGVQGGAIYGSSDHMGAYPASDPVTPGDLAATIYWRFGINPSNEIYDQLARPHRLATGEPLTRLFT